MKKKIFLILIFVVMIFHIVGCEGNNADRIIIALYGNYSQIEANKFEEFIKSKLKKDEKVLVELFEISKEYSTGMTDSYRVAFLAQMKAGKIDLLITDDEDLYNLSKKDGLYKIDTFINSFTTSDFKTSTETYKQENYYGIKLLEKDFKFEKVENSYISIPRTSKKIQSSSNVLKNYTENQ